MAFVHSRNIAILVGAYDLTTYFNSVSVPNEVEEVETTTFGSTEKTFLLGFAESTISLEGYWDGGAAAVDDRLAAALGSATLVPLSLGWNSTTVGNRAVVGTTLEKSYEITAGVGDAVAVSAELRTSGGTGYGVFLHAKGAETANGNSTPVDHLALTSNGAAATLHVTAITGGGTWTIKVQHATSTGGVYADLITFTNVTTITSEYLTVAGTVNRALRVLWSVAGGSGNSITFAVAAARR